MMERYSPDNLIPALFLHIQKTAGTTIVKMAANHYGPEKVCSHGDFIGKQPADLKSLLFVSGHFGFNFAHELLPGRFSFTFLRNPLERVLSNYYFCRTRDPKEFPIYRAASELNLDDFLLAAQNNVVVRRNIWNLQVCLLSGYRLNFAISQVEPYTLLKKAAANLERLSFIGFTETFRDDAVYITKMLNMGVGQGIEKNNVTLGKPLVSELPARTLRLIEEVTRLDQELYNLAWHRREKII